jgi:hypothetical protein
MRASLCALLGLAVALGGCEGETKKGSPRQCQEAMARGRSLLAVPDFGAARDWLAQAKKQCGDDGKAGVEAFEKEIADAEKRQAEVEKKRKEASAPKPVSESSLPALLDAVAKYREEKTRHQKGCDDTQGDDHPLCEGTRPWNGPSLNVASARKDREAFSVFASLSKELVDCARFGEHTVKRSWTSEGSPRFHCALKGGPLAGLEVFVAQEPARPESDLTFFSEPWLKHDPKLAETLGRSAGP